MRFFRRGGVQKISHRSGKSFLRFLLMSPSRIVLASFALVISIGAALLMIPAATVASGSLSLTDALFTSTSATCVTGLVVADTGSAFTPFGRTVILLLIQIGGLGIMTVSTFFMYLISGHLQIFERELLFDTLSQNPIRQLSRLLVTVVAFTIIVETLGFLGLTICFLKDAPLSAAMGMGLFHAVSAFCNAGFSFFSNSFVDYQGDLAVNLILCALIILGGIGFIAVFDLMKTRARNFRGYFRNLSFHTRLVLFSTILLTAGGALVFYLLEHSSSLSNLPLENRMLVSFFQSVTARTAGFNTVDVSALTGATLFCLIILMFIGSSPGGCGGGIKTTTFMVMAASLFARFRMREDVNLFQRRIPRATVSKVTTIVFFSLFFVILFTFLLLVFEVPREAHGQTRGKLMEYLFEAVSAYGTVGLSTGITGDLRVPGKIFIIILMFMGRLGPLTLAIAMKVKTTPVRFRYMEDDVLVG